MSIGAFDQPERLGRYQLIRKLSRGGMGTVYLAKLSGSHGFGKDVAIKVIRNPEADDFQVSSALLDEARISSRIQHSNVCAILDFGVEDDVLYLVMEHLQGLEFSTVLRRGWESGVVPPRFVARIIADAARGLHAAHELCDEAKEPLGVIHRDVSPQNIFVLWEGTTKVLDFGIAQARGRLAVTQVGRVKGKMGYIAPEHARLEPIDRRADIWSLGVVLWEATLGRRLFADATNFNDLQKKPIERPRSIDPDYPSALEDVVMAALERRPNDRTSSAAQFADGLERYLYSSGEPYGAAQVAVWLEKNLASDDEREEKRADVSSTATADGLDAADTKKNAPVVGRRPRRLWLIAAGFLALLIGFGFWFPAWDAPPEVVPPPEKPTKHENADSPVHRIDLPEQFFESSDRPGKLKRRKRQKKSVEAKTDDGYLSLLAIPASVVIWRGREIGRTPLVDRPFPAGRQTLVLRPLRGGPERTIKVTIRSGGTTRRTIRLE